MSKGLAEKTGSVATQEFEVCPFTICVDSNEGAPWQFVGIKGRSKNGVKPPLIIKTVKKPLWNWGLDVHGTGLADYSIDGLEDLIQIERKSIDDLFGTLGSRRENFEREISRLNNQCDAACVMIEGGVGHIMSFKGNGPEPSSVIGTMIAWGQRYPKVHWLPAGSRDAAERMAFRFLERYWLDRQDRMKQEQQGMLSQATEGSTANVCDKKEASSPMGRSQPTNPRSNGH